MSELVIPENIGDLFPHRHRPAKDDEGFSTGTLVPSDSGQWISTAHAFKVAKELIERIARLEAENGQLKNERDSLRLKYALCDADVPAEFEPDLEPLERIMDYAEQQEAENGELKTENERLKSLTALAIICPICQADIGCCCDVNSVALRRPLVHKERIEAVNSELATLRLQLEVMGGKNVREINDAKATRGEGL